MSSSAGIKNKSSVLARRYHAALRRYLKQGPAASLKPALRLGRQAVVLGLETLDLALVHDQALIAQALPIDHPSARDRIFRRSGAFFAEAILPMEETHRSALDANVHLSRLNQALNQRTRDLSASNRRLRREIAKRRVVERALRRSERHSGGLLDQSRHLQEQLRYLSRRILSTQEEERKTISRELHDVIAQTLTGINVQLATLRTEAAVNTRGLTKSIARTQRLVEKSVDIVHRFARELRPAMLDDLGLIPALHSYMKRFMKATGIRVSLTAFAGVKELSNAKRTTLYRVAQEALTNIARHAQASRGRVIIERLANDVRMQIKDNGRSFDVERVFRSRKVRHLGLLGMRERVEMIGGRFMVESAPGQGTTVLVRIPFDSGVGGQRPS